MYEIIRTFLIAYKPTPVNVPTSQPYKRKNYDELMIEVNHGLGIIPLHSSMEKVRFAFPDRVVHIDNVPHTVVEILIPRP